MFASESDILSSTDEIKSTSSSSRFVTWYSDEGGSTPKTFGLFTAQNLNLEYEIRNRTHLSHLARTLYIQRSLPLTHRFLQNTNCFCRHCGLTSRNHLGSP